MARPRHGRKRPQPVIELDGEQEIDDMAVAAQFAAVTYNPPCEKLATSPTGDCNEIELYEESGSGDEESQNEDSSVEGSNASGKKAQTGIDPKLKIDSEERESEEKEDDDDDSHIDMTAELAELEKMEETTAADGPPPKTENELDPYHTPLSELEEKFQLNLSVEETKHYLPDEVKLGEAGRVKNHMVNDRTIIVESFMRDGSSFPLDEGSLLIFQMKEANKTMLVPLGKIFEVFGPVRKPLYTIRLPSPNEIKARSASREVEENDEDTGKEREGEEAMAATTSKQQNVSSSSPAPLNQSESFEEHAQANLPQVTRKPANAIEKEHVKGVTKASVEFGEENEEHSKGRLSGVNAALHQDHWSHDGKYTEFLRKNPEIMILYVQDEAKVIDAGAILKLSMKGCDASNVYDEEVADIHEMYFSDDEEERQLKGKQKNRRSGRSSVVGNGRPSRENRSSGRHGIEDDFRRRVPVPSGFHQPQPMYPSFQNIQQPHPGGFQLVSWGHRVPPPPPPAPGAPQHISHSHKNYRLPNEPTWPAYSQGYGQQHGVNQVPPPPPPPAYPNPNPQYVVYSSSILAPQQQQAQPFPGQHAAQQQSDTVYYDYS